MAGSDSKADLVITGTIVTVDDSRLTAEAPAVAAFIGTGTRAIDVSDGYVMPGFVEAQDHPLMKAIAPPDLIVDDLFGAERGLRWMPAGSAGPRTVPPEPVADLDGRATFPAGRQVYRR
jgi:predicted amidohydrolase YtcJ